MPAGQKYWIEEGTLGNQITNVDVDNDGKPDHYCFTIINKCLHAKHPLGWIRNVTLKIDGQKISNNKAYFVLRGQWISLKHMPTITDIWWNLIEEAEIYVEKEGGLEQGSYIVECNLELSLHVNTLTVDVKDVWPRLYTNLSSEMQVF